MSKRLQVILDDAEMQEIQEIAKRERSTVAEWVRRALRAARRAGPATSSRKKLEVVRAGVQYGFPTGEIDGMLREIEEGSLSGVRES